MWKRVLAILGIVVGVLLSVVGILATIFIFIGFSYGATTSNEEILPFCISPILGLALIVLSRKYLSRLNKQLKEE